MLDCPACIALVTDLHERASSPVIASLHKHRPDLIAIAGDLVHGLDADKHMKTKQNPDVLNFLSSCAAIAPTCMSLGNHEPILCNDDYWLRSETGCVVLGNTWKRIGNLVVGGLTSASVTPATEEWNLGSKKRPWKHHGRASRQTKQNHSHACSPDTRWLRDFCAVEGYHVLLFHHPEYWPFVREHPIDLMLSGHAHGGQWRYYSLRSKRWEGVFAPGQGLFPKLTAGVHDDRLVISRGLANTAPVPRFFNPREIVYVN